MQLEKGKCIPGNTHCNGEKHNIPSVRGNQRHLDQGGHIETAQICGQHSAGDHTTIASLPMAVAKRKQQTGADHNDNEKDTKVREKLLHVHRIRGAKVHQRGGNGV